MDHHHEDTRNSDFTQWLATNNLLPYQDALIAEGYDTQLSLTLMSVAEIDELSEAIQMRPGHRRIFPIKIQKAREEIDKLEAKKKREEDDQEENRKKEKATQKREEQEQEEKRKRDKAKQEREDQEREEIRNREKVQQESKREMKDELAKIEMSWKLERARQKGNLTTSIAAQQEVENKEDSTMHNKTASINLPSDKLHHAFISHKKKHTAFGDHYEMLSIRLKDMLKWRGFNAFMDCDDLQTISQEKLAEAIVKSCCLLLVLSDETLSSEWCRFEVECARRTKIPIVCVIDCDKQILRSVVDGYLESGDSFLFDEQVVSVTSQSREHGYTLIIEAIKRAVQAAFKRKRTALTPAPTSEAQLGRVHDEQDVTPQMELMAALHSEFSTAKAAFDSFSNEQGTISKKEWRRMVKKILPTMPQEDARVLRRKLPKKLSLAQFCELMDEVEPKSEQDTASKSTSDMPSRLAQLPGDVPVLPTSFQSRPYAQEQLVAALLDSGGNSSTAVTAPKSRVSSQGMGGVGKTMLTAAVVRDERVRGAFESIAWIGMSQQPDLLQLQRILYYQLHPENEQMSSKVDLVGSQLIALSKLCSKRILLICLDDVWDSSHEASFACIDTDTASRQLITTRIKGLLPGATEVELELLGLQESVELLAGVACLDGAEISPACLEIAQLCGRLPLCLSIVGNLIRTFGTGWEQQVPGILRKDMRGLTEAGRGSGKGDTPLNLQERVIQSGLDSISGADAGDVVTLFKAMAVFAEDQVVPVTILSVVWVSIEPEKHEPLSAMKLRQHVNVLLSRSILLGSSQDGLSMHDIVRDYTLSSITAPELQQRQRQFVRCILSTIADTSNTKGNTTICTYAHTLLSYHVRGVAVAPLATDTDVQAWLLDDDEDIVDQVLQGVELDDAEKLAVWMAQQEDYFRAGKLWQVMTQHCRGITKSTMSRYYRGAIEAYKHATGQEALERQIKMCDEISNWGDRQEDKDAAIEWLFDLHSDAKRSQQLGEDSEAKLNQGVGFVLLGIKNSKFATPRYRTRAQVQRGSQLLDQFYLSYSKNGEAAEGYLRWYMLGIAFMPVCSQSIHYITHNPSLALQLLGIDGQTVREWHGSYDITYHERCLAQVGHGIHTTWFSSLIFLERYADVTTVRMFEDDWLLADLNSSQSPITKDGFPHNVWSRLSSASLAKSMGAYSLSWRTAESRMSKILDDVWAWTREEDGCIVAAFANTKATLALAQLIILARLPHTVQQSDAADFLPEADDFRFKTLAFDICPMGASPVISAAQTAQNLGMGHMMRQYAQSALQFHLNPLQQYYAHITLGTAVAMEKNKDTNE